MTKGFRICRRVLRLLRIAANASNLKLRLRLYNYYWSIAYDNLNLDSYIHKPNQHVLTDIKMTNLTNVAERK